MVLRMRSLLSTRHFISRLLALAALLVSGEISQVMGQAGAPDPGFQPGALSASNYFMGSSYQADGSILVWGSFSSYAGIARNNAVRLIANGSVDTTFDPPKIAPGGWEGFYDLNTLPDGSILGLCRDTISNQGNRQILRLTRLFQDGSVDASYATAAITYGNVTHYVIQEDGKILVWGDRVFRLNADGTVDSSFTATSLDSGEIQGLLILADGKLLIWGGIRFRQWHWAEIHRPFECKRNAGYYFCRQSCHGHIRKSCGRGNFGIVDPACLPAFRRFLHDPMDPPEPGWRHRSFESDGAIQSLRL